MIFAYCHIRTAVKGLFHMVQSIDQYSNKCYRLSVMAAFLLQRTLEAMHWHKGDLEHP